MLTRLRMIRDGDDAGLTLAELVVAMALLSILMTIGGVFFVSVIQTTNKTTLTNEQTADARITLDSWTAKLRVAAYLDSTHIDRIEELTPTKIVFYANLGNRNTDTFAVGEVSKVVLMLQQADPTSGDGQLIEIVFRDNSSTPTSVRRIALNARPTGGRGAAIFTAFKYDGAELDPVSYPDGCKSGDTVTAGLCLQTLPDGSGMVDPTVGPSSNDVTPGTLTGNPGDTADDVDGTLNSIVAVKIGFTVSDATDTVSQNYQSEVALNSGYAS